MRSGVSTTSKVPGSTCRSSATGEGGPRTGTRVADTAGRLRCASRRLRRRSTSAGEPSPSPGGSETMGTTRGPPEGASELLAVASAFAAFAALAGAFAAALARPGCDDVVDAEDHDRRVGGRGNCLAADPNRFDHVLLLHVGDLAREDVDPRVLVALLVLLPELDQDVDRV